jgi:hypothetical protein
VNATVRGGQPLPSTSKPQYLSSDPHLPKALVTAEPPSAAPIKIQDADPNTVCRPRDARGDITEAALQGTPYKDRLWARSECFVVHGANYIGLVETDSEGNVLYLNIRRNVTFLIDDSSEMTDYLNFNILILAAVLKGKDFGP